MPTARPNKNELVLAVRNFLENNIQAELPPHLGFNLRIAINVLKIVERELALGDNIDSEAKARLLALLALDDHSGLNTHALNQQLVEQISARKLSYQDKALTDHLMATTLDKLSIDNPRYATYQAHLKQTK